MSDWPRIAAAVADAALPAALVDLDAFDANVDRFAAACAAAGKQLRVATKSIRCPTLIRRACDRARTGAVMTYTAAETAFLAGEGFRDLLLAYPTLAAADAAHLAAANRGGACAAVVVDDFAQLAPLATAARAAATTIPVVVELDVALRPLDGALHLGVRRSPLHDAVAVVELAALAAGTPGLRFHGVMGYEAHVAGLDDDSLLLRALKRLARPRVAALRDAAVRALVARGLTPTVVNGGGTGSLLHNVAEGALTEVTAGSAFLAGHLFDGYRGLDLRPSLAFALQVVRRPGAGFVTCHGGGYIASGAAGVDRLPRPVHPPGLRLLPREGAGEVQTPLVVPDGVELRLGELVLFRPAKSGELAEHFNEYLMIAGGSVVGRAPTYRGLGRGFLG